MENRLILNINWPLVICAILLFGVGLVNLYSASGVRGDEGVEVASYFSRQIVWGGAGLVCMLLATIFDYRHLKGLATPLFIFSIGLLLLVLVAGTTVNGARRWISLGFFNFQPSEIVKVSCLIMVAAILSRMKPSLGWLELGTVLVLICAPCVLIFWQPDLGTALSIFFLAGGMILFHGIKASVFKVCCIAIPLMAPLGWLVIEDYHKRRIMTFLDPSSDPRGAGYHIQQSKIAIGSGELWGKGFLGGTQSQLRFLPEKHTDFAIAVFGEEWGFVGCVVLLVLFACFLLSIISTARDAKDRFGSLLCAGIFFYFFLQVLINIGMVVGLFPVVGIPLPFISYGGTAALVNCILLGIVLNVSMRRFFFKAQ